MIDDSMDSTAGGTEPSTVSSDRLRPVKGCMSSQLPSLLTVDETAELLRTTRKAIYTMVERAQLPGVTRIGRRLLFRRTAMLEWLDHKSAPSPKE